jgi:hypothetical protein
MEDDNILETTLKEDPRLTASDVATRFGCRGKTTALNYIKRHGY